MLKKFYSDDDLTVFIKALLIVVFCVALFGASMLLQLLWFEMQPVHHGWDGLIYTAVGRGILNGLIPYRDLFEFKPPGIFLLSATSLWFFDDIRLGNFLQGGCYIAILGLLILPLVRDLQRRAWKMRMSDAILLLSSLVLGMFSVFYLGARAGQFQTESFAAVFAVAFLLSMLSVATMTLPRYLLAGLFLACAVGMKESFLVTVVAATLVMFPLRDSGRTLGWSLLLAIAIGTLVLWIFGYLDPYLTIYLPETLVGRASFNPYPIWVLAFDAFFALRDLFAFSPYFFVALCVLWMMSLLTMARGWQRPNVFVALIALVSSFIALYSFGASFVMRAQSLQHSFDQVPLPTDPLLIPIAIGAAVLLFFQWFALSLFFCREDAIRIFMSFLQHAFAVILSVMTILVGGMLQQQFGSFLSLLAALILSCTVALPFREDRLRAPSLALLFATSIASLGFLFLPSTDYGALLSAQRSSEQVAKAEAREIDGLMSSCGYARYVIFGQPGVPYAYTYHSPFGPAFTRTSFTFPVPWRKPPIPYLQETYRKHLQEAQFVIARSVNADSKSLVDATDIPEDVWKTFEADFTSTPPPCAQAFHASGDMAFRFRKISVQ